MCKKNTDRGAFVSLGQTDALSVSLPVCVCVFLAVVRKHGLLDNDLAEEQWHIQTQKLWLCVFHSLCYRNVQL